MEGICNGCNEYNVIRRGLCRRCRAKERANGIQRGKEGIVERCFENDELETTWQEFKKHRKGIHRRITIFESNVLVARLKKLETEAAVECLEDAITNGWYFPSIDVIGAIYEGGLL